MEIIPYEIEISYPMIVAEPVTVPLRVTVLMPLRDDWVCAATLIRMLNQAIAPDKYALHIFLIDDGSIQTYNAEDFLLEKGAIRTIRITRLRRNLGHQRAIAIGLVLLEQNSEGGAVVVMDSDGEDTVSGVEELLHAYTAANGAKIIFAERSRRSESVVFKFFYRLYKIAHRALVGFNVRVGNFSILSVDALSTLVVMSELWSHYAAAVFRSRLPSDMTPIPRGTRLAGTSTMNFVGLVSHGLSAISVFGDVVGVRLLIGSVGVSLLAALGIVVAVSIRLFTNHAIPGWATSVTGVLLIIMIQLITMATSFVFLVLSNRVSQGFLPARDYSAFVDKTEGVYSYE